MIGIKMQVVESNNITCFDVDNTLVLWNEPYEIDICISYGEEIIDLKRHLGHIALLKHCKQRGDYIIVWSQNGQEWATKVIKKLGLESYVDLVLTKPIRHVDDKTDPQYIIGQRIFLGHE